MMGLNAGHIQTPNPQRGVALISILWLLILMAVIAETLAWSNRHSVSSTASLVGRKQALYVAESAVHLGIYNLLQIETAGRILGDGEVFDLDMPGGKVQLKVNDEFGKVDINRASQSLIARLLYVRDVDFADADAVAAAILDYRDKDDLVRASGAELEEYRAAGMQDGPKNARFTSIEELRKVYGITDEIYEMLYPLVTIHSGRTGINPEVAPLEVLTALSDDSESTLISYVDQRRISAREGTAMPQPPRINRRYLSRTKGLIYRFEVSAISDRSGLAGLTAVVQVRRSRNNAFFDTLEWLPYGALGTDSSSAIDRPGDT